MMTQDRLPLVLTHLGQYCFIQNLLMWSHYGQWWQTHLPALPNTLAQTMTSEHQFHEWGHAFNPLFCQSRNKRKYTSHKQYTLTSIHTFLNITVPQKTISQLWPQCHAPGDFMYFWWLVRKILLCSGGRWVWPGLYVFKMKPRMFSCGSSENMTDIVRKKQDTGPSSGKATWPKNNGSTPQNLRALKLGWKIGQLC